MEIFYAESIKRKKPDHLIELLGGDSRSRTDDPLLAKQVL